MYQGTRLACAEAINNGITHVHDWCHNIRGPAYADADLQGAARVGLARAFLLRLRRRACRTTSSMDLADLEAHARTTGASYSPDGLITLGFAWRGQGGNNPATAIPTEVSNATRSTPRASSACPSPCMPAARARHRPDRRHRQSGLLKQRHADHPCRQGDAGRDQGGGRCRRERSAFRRSPNCASASACRRRQNSSRPGFRSASRSTPSSCPAMPTCSAS